MSCKPIGDQLLWYVIHTKPKQEDRAIKNLAAWNVESFTPKIEQTRLNFYTGEPKHIIKPLFPRYIFARFSVRPLIAKVRFTRGVRSIVSFGDRPTPVENHIIDLIKSRLEKDGYVRIREKLKPGDPVTVEDGILKNLKGVFERQMQDKERVMILLSTVAYQVHLELPGILVKKLNDVTNN